MRFALRPFAGGDGQQLFEKDLGRLLHVRALRENTGVEVDPITVSYTHLATLLDHATLKSADMSAKKQTLTATLTNGLKLQLGVSGDTVSACGGWSCPEFFEAFESGL